MESRRSCRRRDPSRDRTDQVPSSTACVGRPLVHVARCQNVDGLRRPVRCSPRRTHVVSVRQSALARAVNTWTPQLNRLNVSSFQSASSTRVVDDRCRRTWTSSSSAQCRRTSVTIQVCSRRRQPTGEMHQLAVGAQSLPLTPGCARAVDIDLPNGGRRDRRRLPAATGGPRHRRGVRLDISRVYTATGRPLDLGAPSQSDRRSGRASTSSDPARSRTLRPWTAISVGVPWPTRPRSLMLLDTASLYFRAFFGIPDKVKAPDGTSVNAVRGLLDFIAKLVTTYEATHLVACWDDDWRPQWRVDLIPSYKAHRVVAPIAGRRRHRGDARPARHPGPDHPRGARGARHRRRRRARLRGRRRDRHARDQAPACRSTSSPATATCSSWSATTDEVRIIYTARGMSQPRGRHRRRRRAQVRHPARAVRRLRGHARRPLRRPARRQGRRRQDRRQPAAAVRRPRRHRRGRCRPLDQDGVRPARQARWPPTTTSRSRRRSSRWPATSTCPATTSRSSRSIPESLALVAALQEKWNLGGSVTRVLPALGN